VSNLYPPAKTQFKAGSNIPVKFQLNAASGPISPTLAAQLSAACAATVTFDGQKPVCAVYNPTTNSFQANLKTPTGLTVGTVIPITITVTTGGATVGTKTTSITVTK
jgi:hypothetical protein